MAPLRTLVFLAAVAMSVTALPATGVHIRRDETEAVGSVISAVGVSVAPVVGADDTNVDDELLADDFTGFEGDSTDDVFPRTFPVPRFLFVQSELTHSCFFNQESLSH